MMPSRWSISSILQLEKYNFRVKYVFMCMCVCNKRCKKWQQQVRRSREFPYPASPSGPHRATLVEVSSLLWSPRGSAHAVLEEVESAASAYEPTPATGWWWEEHRWGQRVCKVDTNRVYVRCCITGYRPVHRRLLRSPATDRPPHCLQELSALLKQRPASSAVRFISEENWWTQHFTEIHSAVKLELESGKRDAVQFII